MRSARRGAKKRAGKREASELGFVGLATQFGKSKESARVFSRLLDGLRDGRVPQFGESSRDERGRERLVAFEFAAERVGSQERTIRFQEYSVGSNAPRDVPELREFLARIGNESSESEIESHFDEFFRLIQRPAERVNHAARRVWAFAGVEIAQRRHEIVVCVARMNDYGQFRAQPKIEGLQENFPLQIKRRVVPVSVESGFAERDDAAWRRGPFKDEPFAGVPVSRLHESRMIRMKPDGRENEVIFFRKFDSAQRRFQIDGGADDSRDERAEYGIVDLSAFNCGKPSFPGAVKEIGEVGREIVEVDVRVRVDEREISGFGHSFRFRAKDENSANAPFGKRPHIVPESAGRSAIGDAVCAKFARKVLNNLYDCYNRYLKRRFSVIIPENLLFVFSTD